MKGFSLKLDLAFFTLCSLETQFFIFTCHNSPLNRPLDAPALLSTTPTDTFGTISYGGLNNVLQDLTNCIIDNVGEGWLPMRSDNAINTAADPTHYYIQVDFPVTYKVVRIDRQVKKGGTDGDAFIQFGEDENTLDFYRGPTNSVEVFFYSSSSC